MTRAFVIRPFNTKKDRSGRNINFDEIHNELIQPALETFKSLFSSCFGELWVRRRI